MHPPRRSFWAVFVKVNLQLAASGDSNMIAASSLNDMHGDCSGAAPPCWHGPVELAPSSLAQPGRCWGPSARPSAAPLDLNPGAANSQVLARREPPARGCCRDKVSMDPCPCSWTRAITASSRGARWEAPRGPNAIYKQQVQEHHPQLQHQPLCACPRCMSRAGGAQLPPRPPSPAPWEGDSGRSRTFPP